MPSWTEIHDARLYGNPGGGDDPEMYCRTLPAEFFRDPQENTQAVQEPQSTTQATFDYHAAKKLGRALEVQSQRGNEYGDTWALENQHTPTLDMALREIEKIHIKGDHQMGQGAFFFSPEEKRLLTMASLVDVKISRMIGGFKSDTFEDLVNYAAVFCSLMEEYLGQ